MSVEVVLTILGSVQFAACMVMEAMNATRLFKAGKIWTVGYALKAAAAGVAFLDLMVMSAWRLLSVETFQVDGERICLYALPSLATSLYLAGTIRHFLTLRQYVLFAGESKIRELREMTNRMQDTCHR